MSRQTSMYAHQRMHTPGECAYIDPRTSLDGVPIAPAAGVGL
jgi:hypothetical protein